MIQYQIIPNLIKIKIMKTVILILTVFFVFLAGCYASSLAKIERHGNLNLFYLYTRDNPREAVQLYATNASIHTSSVQLSRNTAIVVHGHSGSAFSTLNPLVKDALLTNGDVNVIVLDWSVFASQSYSNAVPAVSGVGVGLANFIQLLIDNNRVSLDRLHLIGFGLGAHVVGFTGRTLNGQVARVTGLDPSSNQWGTNSPRLSTSDARYVEVIHTDGDGLLSNGIGTPIGHVDFFPNGGSNQPGCLYSNTCNHNRAWELFAASLTHDHLVGNICNTQLELILNRCRGYTLALGNNDVVKYGAGIFRLNTGRTYPY